MSKEIQNRKVIPEVASVIQVSKEADKGKELLGKGRAGLQGALLLDAKKPGKDVVLNSDDALLKVKDQIEKGSFAAPTINKGSTYERDKYWKENREDVTTFNKQKEAWEKSANEFFDYYYDNPKEKAGERDVLTKLGMVKGGAKDVYDEYFGDDKGKGEIGYFASKVANNLSYEQIEEHRELLEKIGGFYGKDSSEVAVLLAQGAKNLKENSKKFISAAEDGFNKLTDDDKKILDGVHERAEKLGREETEVVPEPVKSFDSVTTHDPVGKPTEPETKKPVKEYKQKIELNELQPQDALIAPETVGLARTEMEKSIKGMIDGLGTKYYDRLLSEARERGFNIVDLPRENPKLSIQVLTSEWGKNIAGEYKGEALKIQNAIKKGIKDGYIIIDEKKRGDIKEGDIISFLPRKEREYEEISEALVKKIKDVNGVKTADNIIFLTNIIYQGNIEQGINHSLGSSGIDQGISDMMIEFLSFTDKARVEKPEEPVKQVEMRTIVREAVPVKKEEQIEKVAGGKEIISDPRLGPLMDGFDKEIARWKEKIEITESLQKQAEAFEKESSLDKLLFYVSKKIARIVAGEEVIDDLQSSQEYKASLEKQKIERGVLIKVKKEVSEATFEELCEKMIDSEYDESGKVGALESVWRESDVQKKIFNEEFEYNKKNIKSALEIMVGKIREKQDEQSLNKIWTRILHRFPIDVSINSGMQEFYLERKKEITEGEGGGTLAEKKPTDERLKPFVNKYNDVIEKLKIKKFGSTEIEVIGKYESTSRELVSQKNQLMNETLEEVWGNVVNYDYDRAGVNRIQENIELWADTSIWRNIFDIKENMNIAKRIVIEQIKEAKTFKRLREISLSVGQRLPDEGYSKSLEVFKSYHKNFSKIWFSEIWKKEDAKLTNEEELKDYITFYISAHPDSEFYSKMTVNGVIDVGNRKVDQIIDEINKKLGKKDEEKSTI